MKTAVVSVWLTRSGGGLFDSLVGSSREMAKIERTEVHAFGQRDDGAGDDLSHWAGVPVATFAGRGPRAFGYAPALKRRLLAGNFDLIHTHGLWGYPSVIAPAWHTRTRRPYVVSPHGMLDAWALRNSKWKKRLAAALFERAHLRHAACIRALCESEARSIRAFGLSNPICIIPNGIDLAQCAEVNRAGKSEAKWGSTHDERKVLLYLGRLHPKKGLANLVRAWSRARDTAGTAAEPWVLAIAGWEQGGHEAELKRLATDLGIIWRDTRNPPVNQDRKHVLEETSLLFLGPLFGRDKSAAYRHCDAFILPSLSEGLPMVVLEAWAYGKPVLMTPECNLPEGFAAGAARRIEANPESIASELKELFRTPCSDLGSAGKCGRNLAAARFTWVSVARDMHSVYQWLLGGGPKPDCLMFD